MLSVLKTEQVTVELSVAQDEQPNGVVQHASTSHWVRPNEFVTLKAHIQNQSREFFRKLLERIFDVRPNQ